MIFMINNQRHHCSMMMSSDCESFKYPPSLRWRQTVFLSECCDLINVDPIPTGDEISVETNDKNSSNDEHSSNGLKTTVDFGCRRNDAFDVLTSDQCFRPSNIVFGRLSVMPFIPKWFRPKAKPWKVCFETWSLRFSIVSNYSWNWRLRGSSGCWVMELTQSCAKNGVDITWGILRQLVSWGDSKAERRTWYLLGTFMPERWVKGGGCGHIRIQLRATDVVWKAEIAEGSFVPHHLWQVYASVQGPHHIPASSSERYIVVIRAKGEGFFHDSGHRLDRKRASRYRRGRWRSLWQIRHYSVLC